MADALEALIKKAEKKFGPEAIIRGSQMPRELPRATTGSLSFDLMLGGGWPLNQWNEIIGMEHSGKTVMTAKTIAANQALDPNYQTLWVASETFVPDWMEKLGVDLDRVHVFQTGIIEDAFQTIHDWSQSRAVDAIVLDSYPALSPRAEEEKDIGEMSPGRAAILAGQFFRKTGSSTKRLLLSPDRPILGIFINQWREKIGVMHGDPRTTPGGKAKNFSFFTRVEVSRVEWIKAGSGSAADRVGTVMKARTLKNKTAPVGRQAQVDFYFSDWDGHTAGSYDRVKEVTNTALLCDIIERKGAWYQFREYRWQGKDAVFEEVQQDLTLQMALDEEVRKYVLHDDSDA